MSTILRRATMMPRGSGGHNLPPEYQEVEWISNFIEGEGETKKLGYFLTNLYATENTRKVEIKTQISFSDTTSRETRLFGANISQNIRMYNGRFAYTSGPSTLIEYDRFYDLHFTSEIIDGVAYMSVMEGNTVLASSSISREYFPAHNYADFGVGIDVSRADNRFAGSQRTYQILFDGVLMRDYLSCYRKSDNVAGMYDFITKTFNPSIQAGAPFIAGPDVL